MKLNKGITAPIIFSVSPLQFQLHAPELYEPPGIITMIDLELLGWINPFFHDLLSFLCTLMAVNNLNL